MMQHVAEIIFGQKTLELSARLANFNRNVQLTWRQARYDVRQIAIVVRPKRDQHTPVCLIGSLHTRPAVLVVCGKTQEFCRDARTNLR